MSALSCACGQVRLEVAQAPIMVAECYCASCREAARRMGGLPGAPGVVGAHGSTHFVMYRKDRVRITAGQERLRNFRLGPEAQTRRVLASCCNTPVLLEFKGGHWASLYGNLWHGQALPAAELRTQTADAPAGSIGDEALPAGGWETTKFYARLLAAWAAMGFRSPALALDTPEVELPG
jgi:hypothetical protein